MRDPVRIALNKAHYPVTVLGPGRRIGLWLQGCSIGCAGCVSRDTWTADEGHYMPVEALLEWCRSVGAAGLDGITISGGEPFDQAEALEALVDQLVAWRSNAKLDFDLLCYSGYPMKKLERSHHRVLSLLDAIVPEPFVESRPTDLRWRGSANQPIVPLTALGRERYASDAVLPPAMQVRVDGERIWYIGIPKHGDLARIESKCRERGLDFQRVSWRA